MNKHSALISLITVIVLNATGFCAAPVVSTPENTIIPDGKGFVEIKTRVYDAEGDGCRLKVEYSTAGLMGAWHKAYLDQENIYADISPVPDVNNLAAYQIGSAFPVITGSGERTVIFRWDTKSALNAELSISTGDISTIRLRIIPNDGSLDGGAGISAKDFEIDNKPPVPAGNLVYGGVTTESSIRVAFSSAGYDTNFKEYKIFYSTRNNVTENDSVWTKDNADSSCLGHLYFDTKSDVPVGTLAPKTNYYFNIWIYDNSGNTAKANEFGPIQTLPGPLIRDLSAAHAYPVPFMPSSGHSSIIFTKLPENSVIKIYTLSGKVIKTLENSADSSIAWNAVADNGDTAADGTYMYTIRKDSLLKKGKLVILR